MFDDPLADLLVSRQLLSKADAQRWLADARDGRMYLEQVLLERGVFERSALLRILENHHFCPALELERLPYEPRLLELLPRKLASRHLSMPVVADGEAVTVAFGNPGDAKATEAVAFAMRRLVKPAVALRHDLQQHLDRHYERLASDLSAADQARNAPAAGVAREIASQGAVRQLAFVDQQPTTIVSTVLNAAFERRASDVHLQPAEDGLQVRLRLDGLLHTVARFPRDLAAPVASRVKVLARLDLAERRLPQDGRCTFQHRGRAFDLRVSALPSQFGEKLVIRILAKDMALLSLDNLAMPSSVRAAYEDVIASPQGFYLVTGPTGSGKTTTLYATLNAIDRETVNVVTLEDPIEYSLANITQVQIHEDVGLTFAAGLRSILRQDPDVVLVGEIRDPETVEIACRAALTGHKVLSTIHTNDTAQAVTRLIDMGTRPYLITATLRGVLSQRLARRLCQACREPYAANEAERALLGHQDAPTLYRGAGCDQCGFTGYRGRFALYEYLKINEDLHVLILERASPHAIRHAARRAGMETMAEAARRAVLNGTTTLSEVQRVVLSDEEREQVCSRCRHVVSIEYKVCPFCRHALRETCQGCGSPVEPEWEACPTCGRTIDREDRRPHCGHCQAPVEPDWTRCRFCREPR